MVTQAKFGHGAGLTRAGYAISEILTLTLPVRKTAEIKVTNFDSPNNAEEYIPGLKEGDKLTVNCNFRPGDTNGQMGLIADQNTGAIQTYIFTAPPAIGISVQFSGFVTEAEPDFPNDKAATFKAVIKVTGDVVYNANASSNLTALVVSNTTLVPAFVGTAYEYNGTVTPGTTSITVTPTNAAAATILVNGSLVTSGNPSGAILTPVGLTNVTIISQDTGKSPLVTVLHLGRAS
jgi:hypothetical protein